MSIHTTSALAAALLVGTASIALAQETDPNPYNRYPAYNGAVVAAPHGPFQRSVVGLRGTAVGQPQRQTLGIATPPEDRAGRVITGGGF